MVEIPDQPRPLDTREARRAAAVAYAALSHDDHAALTDDQRAVIIAELRAIATCGDEYQPRARRGYRPGRAPEDHVTSARARLDRFRAWALPPIDNTPAGRAARLLAATDDREALQALGGLPAATIAGMRQICDINGWAYMSAHDKRDRHVAYLVERARLTRIHEAARTGDASALYREYEAARRAAAAGDKRPPTRPDMRPRVEVFRGRKLRTQKGREWGTVSTFVNGLASDVNASRFGAGAEGLDKAAEQLRRDVIAADERRVTDPAAYPAEWYAGAPDADPAVVAWCQYAAKRERADRATLTAPDQAPAAALDAQVTAWNAAVESGDPARIEATRRATLAAISTRVMNDDPRAVAAGWTPAADQAHTPAPDPAPAVYVVTFDPRPIAGAGSIQGLARMTLSDARALVADAARVPKRGRIVHAETLDVIDTTPPLAGDQAPAPVTRVQGPMFDRAPIETAGSDAMRAVAAYLMRDQAPAPVEPAPYVSGWSSILPAQ